MNAEEKEQLYTFYDVDNDDDLIETQSKQIIRLQERLAVAEKPFDFRPQRPRR